MPHHIYSYPQLEPTVRNLCFPGDEPLKGPRSLDFGDPEFHLKHSHADVVIFFFGFNESFQGDAGLAEFSEQMTKRVEETRSKNYSGKANARVVVVSPLAFEDIGDSNVPDGKKQNMNPSNYTASLNKIAGEQCGRFADIFTATKSLFEASEEQLTLNGAHLNDAGYNALAPILMKALGGTPKAGEAPENLRAEIKDKNLHWWHRYRAVNGYSVSGKRGLAGEDGTGTYNHRDVTDRERGDP